MVIFGIDPGTNATGYGVVKITGNTPVWVDSGVIKAAGAGTLDKKLLLIFETLSVLMEKHKPDLVCIEEAFYAKNVQTTLVLGHARGVAMLAAVKNGARVAEFSPRTIKKAVTGNGNATKEQVEYMVKFLLSPPKKHEKSDPYDAMAAALCGFTHSPTGIK